MVAENRDGRELSMDPGFSSLHWCHPSWYLQFKARIQFLLSLFPRRPKQENETRLCLSGCWMLFLSLWLGVGSRQSVLSYGHYWHPFLCFEDCTEKEQGEGGAQSWEPKAFAPTLKMLFKSQIFFWLVGSQSHTSPTQSLYNLPIAVTCPLE